MSTVSVTNLKHESASGNNITLTSAGNVLIGGTTFDTGAFSGSAGGVNVFDATHPIVNVVESTGGTSFYFAKSTTECFIGTADAQTIRFHTNDVGRMFIDSAGRVTTPYQPAFYARAGAAQNPGSVYTVQFTTADLNIGGHYNTSNYRFTAPVAGIYFFSFTGMSNAGYNRYGLFKNGTMYGDQFFSAAQAYENFGSTWVISLAVNDYVEIKNDLSSSSQGDIHNDYRNFTGYLLG